MQREAAALCNYDDSNIDCYNANDTDNDNDSANSGDNNNTKNSNSNTNDNKNTVHAPSKVHKTP